MPIVTCSQIFCEGYNPESKTNCYFRDNPAMVVDQLKIKYCTGVKKISAWDKLQLDIKR